MSTTETTERDPLVFSRKRTARELDTSVDFVDAAAARGDLERVDLGPRKVGITSRSVRALIARGLGR